MNFIRVSCIDSMFTSESIVILSEAITLLKIASGSVDDNFNKIISIDDLLHKYKVGTESFKMDPGPPNKDIHKLGPLRNISLMNLLTKAKKK